jgi:hypothetical protein
MTAIVKIMLRHQFFVVVGLNAERPRNIYRDRNIASQHVQYFFATGTTGIFQRMGAFCRVVSTKLVTLYFEDTG